jgi:type VI protein secretion system component VasF
MAELPKVQQIAVAHGYGDSVADTLYALCVDGTIWGRGVRHDDRWHELSLETEPIAESMPAKM